MSQYNLIKKALDASGIRKHEFCRLNSNMSRMTLYHWEQGVTPRVRLQYDNAIRWCQIILRAVELKFLPLPTGVSPKDRWGLICEILKKARNGQ